MVFLNGCITADERAGSATDAFKNAFNTEIYIGWNAIVMPYDAAPKGRDVFKYLDGGKFIKRVFEDDIYPMSDFGLNLKYLGTEKDNKPIDLSP